MQRTCGWRKSVAGVGAAAVALLAGGEARAATNWWDGPTAGWDAVASWSTVSSATTPNPGSVPGASDTAIFSIDGYNTGGPYISLNANQSIYEMIFRNTGGQIIRANATALQPGRTLTIGAGGVTTLPGSGAVGLFNRDPLTYAIGADQVWRVAGGALNIALSPANGASTDRTIITDQGDSKSLTLVYGTLNVGINDATDGLPRDNAITSLSALNLGAGGYLQLTSRGAGFYADRIADSIPINSYGGTFYNFINIPVATVLYTETVGTVTLVKGALKQITVQTAASGTNVLTYSGLSRPAGSLGTIAFNPGGLGGLGDATAYARNKLVITGQADTNLIGGWATAGVGSVFGFAAYSSTRGVYNNAGSTLTATTSDSGNVFANGSMANSSDVLVGAYTLNSTLDMKTRKMTIASGGLMNPANNSIASMYNGTLTAGASGGASAPLYVWTTTPNIAGNSYQHINAVIANNNSGNLDLVKSGPGPLGLGGVNTYGGSTVVNEGTLQINKASAQSNFGTCDGTANITVADTSVFAPGMQLSSSVSSPSLGTRYVVAISSPTVLVASSTIPNNHNGALSAPAISGTIASSPTIEVLYGATLDVTYHRTATWTVGSAQTLKGNGTVVAKDPAGANRTIQIDGTVAPGSSAGTLTVNGNVVFANNSILEIETKSALLGGDKWESGYDRLNVAGTIDLGSNAKLDVKLLAGATLALGDRLFIVNNDDTDAVSGKFKTPSGRVLNEGDAFAVGEKGFKVYYAADTATGALTGGNDVALEVVKSPSVAGTVVIFR